MRTEEAMQKLSQGDPAKMDKVRQEAWEDFLDMTIAQALTWAAQNIAPEVTPSEIVLAEPYIMGRTPARRAPGSAARRTCRRLNTSGATTK